MRRNSAPCFAKWPAMPAMLIVDGLSQGATPQVRLVPSQSQNDSVSIYG